MKATASHGCVASHAAPGAPPTAQVPPMQRYPTPHGLSSAQLPPRGTVVAQTPVVAQAVPLAHVFVPFWHAPPSGVRGLQTPHGPWSSQYVLSHCSFAPHATPSARSPGAIWQLER